MDNIAVIVYIIIIAGAIYSSVKKTKKDKNVSNSTNNAVNRNVQYRTQQRPMTDAEKYSLRPKTGTIDDNNHGLFSSNAHEEHSHTDFSKYYGSNNVSYDNFIKEDEIRSRYGHNDDFVTRELRREREEYAMEKRNPNR